MTSRRRLLLLAGLLSLLLSNLPLAFAQTPAAEITPARVSFISYKNFDDLNKQMPEARQIVETYGPKSQDQLVEPTGYVAKVSDRLILFRFENTGNCGALGCTLLGFSIGEEGYYLSMYLVTPGPILAAITDKEPSVFVCPREGSEVEWRRQDSDQMMPVTLPAGQTARTCTPELSITEQKPVSP